MTDLNTPALLAKLLRGTFTIGQQLTPAQIEMFNQLESLTAPSADWVMVPFDDDVKDILGRPSFTLGGIANSLRRIGHNIPRKAESEQAVCLHWMLNLYLKHGSKWQEAGNAELAAAPLPEPPKDAR